MKAASEEMWIEQSCCFILLLEMVMEIHYFLKQLPKRNQNETSIQSFAWCCVFIYLKSNFLNYDIQNRKWWPVTSHFRFNVFNNLWTFSPRKVTKLCQQFIWVPFWNFHPREMHDKNNKKCLPSIPLSFESWHLSIYSHTSALNCFKIHWIQYSMHFEAEFLSWHLSFSR